MASNRGSGAHLCALQTPVTEAIAHLWISAIAAGHQYGVLAGVGTLRAAHLTTIVTPPPPPPPPPGSALWPLVPQMVTSLLTLHAAAPSAEWLRVGRDCCGFGPGARRPEGPAACALMEVLSPSGLLASLAAAASPSAPPRAKPPHVPIIGSPAAAAIAAARPLQPGQAEALSARLGDLVFEMVSVCLEMHGESVATLPRCPPPTIRSSSPLPAHRAPACWTPPLPRWDAPSRPRRPSSPTRRCSRRRFASAGRSCPRSVTRCSCRWPRPWRRPPAASCPPQRRSPPPRRR